MSELETVCREFIDAHRKKEACRKMRRECIQDCEQYCKPDYESGDRGSSVCHVDHVAGEDDMCDPCKKAQQYHIGFTEQSKRKTSLLRKMVRMIEKEARV